MEPQLQQLLRDASAHVLRNARASAAVVASCSLQSQYNNRDRRRNCRGAEQNTPASEETVAALRTGPSCGSLLDPGKTWSLQGKQVLLLVIKHFSNSSERVSRFYMRGSTEAAIEALGLAQVQGQQRELLAVRVRNKLAAMRMQLARGLDPLESFKCKANPRHTWLAWIREAFLQLSGYQGTSEDVCRVLDAHPNVSPLLDRRPDPHASSRPKWKGIVSNMAKRVGGVVDTGLRVGRLHVLQYRTQDPAAAPTPRPKALRKGAPGLPHLGRHEQSRGMDPPATSHPA